MASSRGPSAQEQNTQAERADDVSGQPKAERSPGDRAAATPGLITPPDIAHEAPGYADNAPLGEGSGTQTPPQDASKSGGLLGKLKGALGLGEDTESEERGSGADSGGSQSGTRSDPNASRNLGSDQGRAKSE